MSSWRCFPFVDSTPRAYRLKASNAASSSSTSNGTIPSVPSRLGSPLLTRRLWREKRGEVEPEDLSGNLIVQLGSATEELNRPWYERNTGRRVPRRAAPGPAFGHPMDGGYPRRNRGGNGGGVRVQIHAALVLLRGSSRGKVHVPAAAQHVGHPPAQCL
jgi:hypothetical protein